MVQNRMKPMTQAPHVNRRVLLETRPNGAPTAANFRFDEHDIVLPLAGQVLTQTLYLSLDPYMRGRMSDAPSYAAPVGLGDVMVGATVSRVIASENNAFKAGDLVLGFGGWQAFALSDGEGLTQLDAGLTKP